MTSDWHRRDVLRLAGSGLGILAAHGTGIGDPCLAAQPAPLGCVSGHPEGAQAGMDVLAAGGNAVETWGALFQPRSAVMKPAMSAFGSVPAGSRVETLARSVGAPVIGATKSNFALSEFDTVTGFWVLGKAPPLNVAV